MPSKSLKLSLGWILPLVAIILSGCSQSLSEIEQSEGTRYLLLDSENQIGQTFTASYGGLDGISLDLKPVEFSQGEIWLHLRQDPSDRVDLRTSRIDISTIKKRDIYQFKFPPIPESSQRSYYLLIETPSTGQLAVRTGNGESYLHGALYLNGAPQEAQLKFGLSYALKSLIRGLILEGYHWLLWLLAGMFLFFLPGWGILSAFWPAQSDRHWVEIFGLSLGISLAVHPVLMVFADLVRLSPGSWFAWAPGVMGAVSGLWFNRKWVKQKSSSCSGIKNIRFSQKPGAQPNILAEIVLILSVALLIISRFWAIRSIDAPMWGDSVHHTAITQLILDNRGLFNSWEPYSPHQTFSMQFGFSAGAALFSWLTGLPAYRSVLISGQLINLIAIFSLLPLSYRLGRRSLWGASTTMIAAGLLSWMPAFYVNWGRYAQLTGQAIIPVGLWLLWDFLDRVSSPAGRADILPDEQADGPVQAVQRIGRGRWLVCSLVIGCVLSGMVLSSYRLIIFFITYIPALMLALWLTSRNSRSFRWRFILLALIACSAAVFMFLAPWTPRLVGNTLTQMVVEGAAQTQPAESVWQSLQEWGNLETYQPWYLVGAAVVGFVWSILRRRYEVVAIGLWVLFTQLYYLGQLVRLPLANMLQVFAVLIWLYMPVSLLAGVLLAALIEKISLYSRRRSLSFLLMVLLSVAAVVGANQVRLLSRPQAYAMVARPDLRAMDWIRSHTDTASIFLIEGSRVTGRESFVGTDAGWWIPILTGRGNTIPPQYAFGIEEESKPGHMQDLVQLVVLLEDHAPADPAVMSELCRLGITHIYIGQRQGMVGSGTRRLFSPQDLSGNPAFAPLYHQDRVYIFKLNQAFCRN